MKNKGEKNAIRLPPPRKRQNHIINHPAFQRGFFACALFKFTAVSNRAVTIQLVLTNVPSMVLITDVPLLLLLCCFLGLFRHFNIHESLLLIQILRLTYLLTSRYMYFALYFSCHLPHGQEKVKPKSF